MRKRILWILLAAALAGSMVSCGTEAEDEKQQEETVSEDAGDTEEAIENAEGEAQQQETEEEDAETGKILIVYYQDDNAEIQSKPEEVSEVTPETVWEALQDANAGLAGASLISCDVKESEKKIDLNLSSDFAGYLQTAGTAEETNLVTAIVNTYLDAFSCEQIKILDEGKVLCSSHKEYDKYMEKR